MATSMICSRQENENLSPFTSVQMNGYFKISKKLDTLTQKIFEGLMKTRRYKRDLHVLAELYGITNEDAFNTWGPDAQFYFGNDETSILDKTEPPVNQVSTRMPFMYFINENDEPLLVWDSDITDVNSVGDAAEWIIYLLRFVFQDEFLLSGRLAYTSDDLHYNGIIHIFQKLNGEGIMETKMSLLESCPECGNKVTQVK
mgnify:CR=1 FL=1|jgi:hypothetical protein